MKQRLHPLCVALLALVLCNTPLFAHNFEVDGIYYNITSETDKTVAVTYQGNSYSENYHEYSGSVTIPESVTYNGNTYSVTTIGTRTFMGCSKMTSVTIPNSITTLGEYAFSNCRSLTEIFIPNSVTTFEFGVFQFCTNLAVISLSNNLTIIENGTFSGCSNLRSITIPNSVTTIGEFAFSGCTILTDITFSNRLTTIMREAFDCCSSLMRIDIPSSVTKIEPGAFTNCPNLSEILVAADNPKYDSRDNCNALIETETNTLVLGTKNTIVPNDVTTIGRAAFTTCSGLTSITIPNSVTTIEDAAFENCSNLASITIPNSVTTIGNSAFALTGLVSITIPNSVTTIGEAPFQFCSHLMSITVAEDNARYDSRDNSNSIIETQTNTLIAACSKTTIPNSVTTLGNYAFSGCTDLTSITIPNSVTTIGESAFAFTGLVSITIPKSVTSIGGYAFMDCSSLTEITIPNSVTTIGFAAFFGCDNLTTATVGCSWKNNPLYDFGENVTVNATLHSYENGVCMVCGEASEDDGERIEFVEGTPFENEEAREVAQVTYNRTLPNLEWNALYLPVEIPVAALIEDYDLAYFNNMHAYDRNNDGTVDEMDMEVFLINEGTLHANYPYFIRAKREDAKQLQLVLEDVVLHAAEETSLTCSSVFIDFALTGVYARNDAETLSGCYAINTSGAWSPIAAGSYLNPFRCYLKMTARDGSPVKVDEALQSIRIRVKGEGGTTGIDNMTINGQQPAAIYDLQGRRVMVPQKGKIYIVGGKKMVF